MIIVINDYTKFQQNSTLSSQIIDREKKTRLETETQPVIQ